MCRRACGDADGPGHGDREEMARGRMPSAGQGPDGPRSAPGEAVVLLLPPHRAVHVRSGAAGCRRCPPRPGPAARRHPRRRPGRPAPGLARHRHAARHPRQPAACRPRHGQGQRPRGPPPGPPRCRAHDPRRPRGRLRLVTMETPPPGTRPLAPLPRPPQSSCPPPVTRTRRKRGRYVTAAVVRCDHGAVLA